MKRHVFLAVAIMLMAPAITLAQAAAVQPPKPGPEHQKLAGLVGNWTSEGECSEWPFGPAEKYASKIKAEWFPGNFAVVRHLVSKSSASGDSVGMEVVAYDSRVKVYTWSGIDSIGFNAIGKASISKDTLTINWTDRAKGKIYKIRGTLQGLGSDKFLWSVTYSEDGKAWTPVCKGTDVRVKAN